MIRYRMAQVDSAADRAIEWLRAPKPMEEVAPAILAVLAQAAGSVRAAYWVFDAVGERLRPFVTWSPSGTEAPMPGQEAPLLALGFRNAAIAWCGGKPVWSTMPIPESLSSPQDSTSPPRPSSAACTSQREAVAASWHQSPHSPAATRESPHHAGAPAWSSLAAIQSRHCRSRQSETETSA